MSIEKELQCYKINCNWQNFFKLSFNLFSQNSMNLDSVREDAGQAYPIEGMDEVMASKKNSYSGAPTSATHGFTSPGAVMSARPAKYSRSNDYDYYKY